MLEERFKTKLPNETLNVKNHVVIFDHGPTVATLIDELVNAGIPTVIIDEDEIEARHLPVQGHQVIFGNRDEGVLAKSNLAQARALIVNGSDEPQRGDHTSSAPVRLRRRNPCVGGLIPPRATKKLNSPLVGLFSFRDSQG